MSLRQLRNRRRGFQNAFLGKGAQVGNVHRGGVRIQRQRRTAHVHAVKGRRRAVQGCAAAPDTPLAIFHQLQVCAVAVQRGDLPREGGIDVDHQVAAQAEFLQRDAVQPFRQRLHPQRFPVLRQGVLQPGDGNIVQHQRFTVAQPVTGRAHHAAFPAGGELSQRHALRGKLRIQDRVEKMQRAVDKLAGVHGQPAFLALPVAFAESQVAQA